MAKSAIAVIGLSTFGTALVRQLAACGCRILAADRDGERVNAIRDIGDEAIIADVNPDPNTPVTAGTGLVVFGRHEDIDRMLEG